MREQTETIFITNVVHRHYWIQLPS